MHSDFHFFWNFYFPIAWGHGEEGRERGGHGGRPGPQAPSPRGERRQSRRKGKIMAQIFHRFSVMIFFNFFLEDNVVKINWLKLHLLQISHYNFFANFLRGKRRQGRRKGKTKTSFFVDFLFKICFTNFQIFYYDFFANSLRGKCPRSRRRAKIASFADFLLCSFLQFFLQENVLKVDEGGKPNIHFLRIFCRYIFLQIFLVKE